jgi:hypothetical protein
MCSGVMGTLSRMPSGRNSCTVTRSIIVHP